MYYVIMYTVKHVIWQYLISESAHRIDFYVTPAIRA